MIHVAALTKSSIQGNNLKVICSTKVYARGIGGKKSEGFNQGRVQARRAKELKRRAAGVSSRFWFSDVKGFDAIGRDKSRDALDGCAPSESIPMRPKAGEFRGPIVMVRHDSPTVCAMWRAMCAVDDGVLRLETASHGRYFCYVPLMIKLIPSQERDNLSSLQNKDEEK